MNDRTPVQVSSVPAPIGPYSQGIKCGNQVYISGQLALDAKGNLIPGTPAQQTTHILNSINGILDAVGGSLARVCKTTIFLTDLNDFAEVNKVYGEFFPFEPPARSTVQVAALPKGARVEIEAIAVLAETAAKMGGGLM